MKKIVYIHAPDMPGWQSMLVDILEKMDTSGMIDAVDEIKICGNGVRSAMEIALLPLLRAHDKFKLVQVNGDPTKWEWPTINLLKHEADAATEDYYACYVHLKGLTRPEEQKAIDWRNFLVYWTVEKWQENIAHLEAGSELVGVNWLDQPWPHLSGNMWWTTANYLRRLPLLQDPSTVVWGTKSKLLKPDIALDPGNVRYECEAWIGQGKPIVHEISHSHAKADTSFHYNNEYPSTKYRK